MCVFEAWSNTEKSRMGLAPGGHAQIEKCLSAPAPSLSLEPEASRTSSHMYMSSCHAMCCICSLTACRSVSTPKLMRNLHRVICCTVAQRAEIPRKALATKCEGRTLQSFAKDLSTRSPKILQPEALNPGILQPKP